MNRATEAPDHRLLVTAHVLIHIIQHVTRIIQAKLYHLYYNTCMYYTQIAQIFICLKNACETKLICQFTSQKYSSLLGIYIKVKLYPSGQY